MPHGVCSVSITHVNYQSIIKSFKCMSFSSDLNDFIVFTVVVSVIYDVHVFMSVQSTVDESQNITKHIIQKV